MAKGRHRRHIVHFSSSLRVGGAETVLYELIKNIQKQGGYSQKVYYIHDGFIREKIEALGIESIPISGFLWTYDPFFLWRLYWQTYQDDPVVIHTILWAAGFFGRLIGLLRKIPVVSAVHSPSGGFGLIGYIRELLDMYTMRYATAIVAVAENIQSALCVYNTVPYKKIHLIPNGIPVQDVFLAAHKSRLCRQNFGIPDSAFLIGAVGRLVSLKNIDQLIGAIAQLRSTGVDVYLLIIGNGPEQIRLQQYAQYLGCSEYCIFIGEVNPAWEYLGIIDCFVQPSAYEGLSIALLEALAAQVPVVVSRAAASVIINGKSGIVLPAVSSEAIALAITMIMNDQPLQARLSMAGSRLVYSQHRSMKMALAYRVLFNMVIRDFSYKKA